MQLPKDVLSYATVPAPPLLARVQPCLKDDETCTYACVGSSSPCWVLCLLGGTILCQHGDGCKLEVSLAGEQAHACCKHTSWLMAARLMHKIRDAA